MRQLLNKFRIPVSDVVVIPDVTLPPSSSTKTWFDAFTNEFVRKDDDATVQGSTSKFSFKNDQYLRCKQTKTR